MIKCVRDNLVLGRVNVLRTLGALLRTLLSPATPGMFWVFLWILKELSII